MSDNGINGEMRQLESKPTAAFTQVQVQPHQTQNTPGNENAMAAFMPVMSIEAAIARWEAIHQFIGRIMQPDEDFGTIPGSKKPSLLKPGAEKLTAFFGLVPTYDISDQIEDWSGERFEGEPFFYYRITCRLIRNGLLMGEGIGSCNTREVKYRYRDSERKCPVCNGAAIIKGKEQYGGGWLCFRKKGGCGATFEVGDRRIEGQQLGRVLNPDVADLCNTVLKMAKKRAHVDAVLNTTGASQFFTQDVEDEMPREQHAPPLPNTSSSDWAGIDIGLNSGNTKAAQEYVRDRKLEELRSKPAQSERSSTAPTPKNLEGATRRQIKDAFAELREYLGEVVYNREIGKRNLPGNDPSQIHYLKDIIALYDELWAIARREAA